MSKQKTAVSSTFTSSRPRMIRIGPGLIIALLVALFIVVRWLQSERTAQQQSILPPIVEKPLVIPEQEKLGPTPEVNFILQHKLALKLTASQIQQLGKLQDQWQRFSAPKQQQLKRSAQATEKYLQGAQNQHRTPAAQIEDQAKDVIVLSRELSSERQRLWSRALTVLTLTQQKAVNQERIKAWTASHKITK
jgi:hypothetical protein